MQEYDRLREQLAVQFGHLLPTFRQAVGYDRAQAQAMTKAVLT